MWDLFVSQVQKALGVDMQNIMLCSITLCFPVVPLCVLWDTQHETDECPFS